MAKYCPSCGDELPDGANFCKSCGSSIYGDRPAQAPPRPMIEKSYTIAVILGYVFAIFVPILGLIIGIYLVTRKDSPSASRHGKFVIILTVIVWILGFFTLLRFF